MRLFVHSSSPPLPTTVSILTEQPRPGQTRRTAAGGFPRDFLRTPVKVGRWLHGPGTLGKTHFFPAGRVSSSLVGLLPKVPFQTETEQQKPLPLEPGELAGLGKSLKNSVGVVVNGTLPELEGIRENGSSLKRTWQ